VVSNRMRQSLVSTSTSTRFMPSLLVASAVRCGANAPRCQNNVRLGLTVAQGSGRSGLARAARGDELYAACVSRPGSIWHRRAVLVEHLG